ncbi:hypothetical protein P7K49_033368 [Saguinus oedipus]|uniref:Uncharacterized protein n=1 Tax=Saguinus oedipus TaxID=9490 RepID=A0ABQ9TRQ9_SAGOE|nr:hypothetical protein P7K49_033368 [Saguinus oedipus]
MPAIRAAPRAWLSPTTHCLCLLESDQVRNGGPRRGAVGEVAEHLGAAGQVKGPGLTLSDSPKLSEWAVVQQPVGMEASPCFTQHLVEDQAGPLGCLPSS